MWACTTLIGQVDPITNPPWRGSGQKDGLGNDKRPSRKVRVYSFRWNQERARTRTACRERRKELASHDRSCPGSLSHFRGPRHIEIGRSCPQVVGHLPRNRHCRPNPEPHTQRVQGQSSRWPMAGASCKSDFTSSCCDIGLSQFPWYKKIGPLTAGWNNRVTPRSLISPHYSRPMKADFHFAPTGARASSP